MFIFIAAVLFAFMACCISNVVMLKSFSAMRGVVWEYLLITRCVVILGEPVTKFFWGVIMFYEVLMEKRANRINRAKEILRGMSEEDRSDLLAGKSVHDRGITDERTYRKDLRGRRARFGAAVGGVLGTGLGLIGGEITGKPLKSTLIGAGAGAGLGGLLGAGTVHRGKDDFYMNDVQRVKNLIKQHKFPKLSDEDRTALYEEGYTGFPY